MTNELEIEKLKRQIYDLRSAMEAMTMTIEYMLEWQKAMMRAMKEMGDQPDNQGDYL